MKDSVKGYGVNSLNRGKFTNFTELFCAVMGKKKNVFNSNNRMLIKPTFDLEGH